MSESSSLLSALPPKNAKSSNQFKALFLKSTTLQLKQIGTNVCQILTPIICLLFTFVIQVIASANMEMETNNFSKPIPLGHVPKNILHQFVYFECPQWFLYQIESQKNINNFIGEKPGYLEHPGSQFLSKVTNMSNNIICDFKYQNETKVQEKVYSTFFRKTNYSSVNQDIAFRFNYINENSKIDQNMMFIPDAAVKFHDASDKILNATLLVNDERTFQYHRGSGISAMFLNFNGTYNSNYSLQYTVAEGQLAFMGLLNSAYLKQTKNKQIKSSAIIMPPGKKGSILIDSIVNIVGATIFPLALSLLFPVFLYAIVLEKEERLIQMMKMNGMSMTYYWLVTFIFNLILSLITGIIFYMFGYFLLKSTFFIQTPFIMMFVILFGWMLAQIGLAIFFQTFLSNSRTANIIGYLLSVWTSMIASGLNIGVYQLPTAFPIVLRMYAPLGFTRIFYVMLSKCSLGQCIRSWSGVTGQLRDCIIFLYVFFAITFILGIYLHEIIPQQYGVSRSPLYPIQMCKKNHTSQDDTQEDPELHKYIKEGDQDSDSRAERAKVERFQQDLSQYPLVCNNIRKLYQKQGRTEPYAANKSFNLVIQPKEIFGLLGPNGAGKTTLISLITGMFEPDNGNAWVAGYSIKDQIQQVHLQMGVCPQFDLLWPEMTVEEHLKFYARLKGSPNIKQSVDKAIEEVNLQQFTKFKTTQLSGGMKRRLSVAISLVGNPVIVFLDEPTTGLDPDNRRQLWSIISKCKQQRAIFLTTHMMDQADTLCNRIGIITNGILRTVNNQIKLKKKYGGGYRLDINLVKKQPNLRQSMLEPNPHDTINYSKQVSKHMENYQQIDDSEFLPPNQLNEQYDFQDKNKAQLIKFIKNNFQDSYLVKNFNTNFIFKLGPNIVVSDVFELLDKNKQNLGIAQWGVINSSLEDVFMAVVQKFDQEDKIREDLAASVIRTGNNNRSNSGGSRSSVVIEEVASKKQRKQSGESSYVRNRESVLSN